MRLLASPFGQGFIVKLFFGGVTLINFRFALFSCRLLDGYDAVHESGASQD